MVIKTETEAVVKSTVPVGDEATSSSEVPPVVEEKEEKAPAGNSQLDLAFCCDCTGSMGSYIAQAQENIRNIAKEISETADADIHLGLVTYRDHPPQDSSYVTKKFDFTSSLETMQGYVNTMSASGGGDGPEAVADGLHDILHMDWRPNATKVCVLISDAPPHGLGENNDGFPNGCPDGHDPIQICRQLAALGVTVYAVGVEPILSSSYKFARDFMMSVASITNGKYLPLGKADLLTKVIVGGSLQGLKLEALWAEMEKDLKEVAEKAKGSGKSEEVLIEEAHKKLAAKSAMAWDVTTSNPYGDHYDARNIHRFEEATSLSSARVGLSDAVNLEAKRNVESYSFGAQVCASGAAPLAQAQVQQMCKKKGWSFF